MRLWREYRGLARILELQDILSLTGTTVVQAPAILRSRRLTALDTAMSRDMTVRFGNSRMTLPLAEIDRMLAAENDNPTFGNVREIYARNCYLEHLRLDMPQRTVLDLGANRGMFTLLALAALGAEVVVGVEPTSYYGPVQKLLLEANGIGPERAPRYTKFIASPSGEHRDPDHNISIQTLLREQKIGRFNLVKMDIEGHERAIFSEPEWLSSVDNISMELHPELEDMAAIPQTLKQYGFEYRLMDQAGSPAGIESAVFLVASAVGALA